MRQPNAGSMIDTLKTLLVRRSLYPVYRLLFQIGVRGLGILNYENPYLTGEHHVLSHLSQHASAGDDLVIFDVGANVGVYSDMVKKLYPHARVYAFEPHPTTFVTLDQHAEQNGYKAFNLGLDKLPGEVTLFDRSDILGSAHASQYPDVIEHIHGQAPLAVPVLMTTVDQFAEAQGVSRIHLLKIDTEGNEFNVLLGARRLIQDGMVDLIQFEFNTMNVVSRVFIADFMSLLSSYDLYRMLPYGLVDLATMGTTEREIFGFQNILAIRRSDNLAPQGRF
jgi:FkbM family methyltransferase